MGAIKSSHEGAIAYGILGIFLGPILIATLAAFVQIYREDYFLKS